MSETMKKRYEDVSATLCAIHGLKYSHCLTREEAEAIESLLDDLMAERGKKINLDEIFPKELTRPGVYYIWGRDGEWHQWTSTSILKALSHAFYNLTYHNGPTSPVVDVEVCRDDWSKGGKRERLARVRVRLGLTVEIVESK